MGCWRHDQPDALRHRLIPGGYVGLGTSSYNPNVSVTSVTDTEVAITILNDGFTVGGLLDVFYTDSAGRTAIFPASFEFTFGTPTLDTIDPAEMTHGRACNVTVTGTNLLPNGVLTIGTETCQQWTAAADGLTGTAIAPGTLAANAYPVVYTSPESTPQVTDPPLTFTYT